MRRLQFVIFTYVLLFSVITSAAWVAPYTYRYEMVTCPDGSNPGMCIAAQTCSVGSCSGTAPSGPNEGMILFGVVSYRLTICAAAGQTLSGGGTVLAYRYDGAEGLWPPNHYLDQAVPSTASGQRCHTFPDFIVIGGQTGRVRFVASSVTVSGGTTLDVLLEGYGPVN